MGNVAGWTGSILTAGIVKPSTISDAIADKKTYYNCPRCNARVWAYGQYVGRACLNCEPLDPATQAKLDVKLIYLFIYI